MKEFRVFFVGVFILEEAQVGSSAGQKDKGP
jgi:hypothetical protein